MDAVKPPSPTSISHPPAMSNNRDQDELVRAISQKDVQAVREVVGRVSLNRNYHRLSWSERVVQNFDPEVAKILDEAGMPMRKVRRMLQEASVKDDSQAFAWVFDHPKCVDFFSLTPMRDTGKGVFRGHLPWSQDYTFIKNPTESDLAVANPFLRMPQGAKKVKLYLMSHPGYDRYASALSTTHYNFIKQLITEGDWQGVGFVFDNTSKHLGRGVAVSKMRQHLKDMAENEPLSGVLNAHSELPQRITRYLFTSKSPFEIPPPYPGTSWFKKIGTKPPRVPVLTLSQVALISASDLTLELLEDKDLLDFYKQNLAEPDTGSTILASLASRRTFEEVGQVLEKVKDVLDDWKDSQGYNPAHILMHTRPTAGLAKVLFNINANWLAEKVNDLPIPLEMIAHGSINEVRKQTQANVRRHVLKSMTKGRGSTPKPSPGKRPGVRM